MTKHSGSVVSFAARAEQPTAGLRPATSPDAGTERWLGVSDPRAQSRRPDSFRLIGTAHGPRLLELLRAS